MALFTLTDIQLNKNASTRKGKTGKPLVGGKYNTFLHRYPEDIGNYDKGHYVIIHINEQERTQFAFGEYADQATIYTNYQKYGKSSLNQGVGKIVSNESLQNLSNSLKESVTGGYAKIVENSPDFLKGALDVIGGAAGGVSSVTSEAAKNYQNVVAGRTIKRTTETIALYMPDTLNFTQQQQYSDLTLGGLGSALIAGGASAADALKKGGTPTEISKSVATNLSPFLASYFLNQSDLGKSIFTSAFGVVQNPLLELIYTSPQFRSFRFDFMFYPRSEKEAMEVQKILNRLKFHQAPEIRKEFNGFFLVPPSEFDIKFMYNGAENPNIPSISTCVLESIDIDYAPNGFAAYETPGNLKPELGGTGMPVAIRLSLQFKETEIMTKDNYPEIGLPEGTVTVGPLTRSE